MIGAFFTNFGRLHQGLNPLTSLVEACGLAETVSLPLGTELASFLSEIEIDRHPVFDAYAGPIQERLRSSDPEERVHGLRLFQLALQIGGPDGSAAAFLSESLRDPKRSDLRKSLAAQTRLARRELASQEPGAPIPRDTGFEGRVRSWLAGASDTDENIGKLRLWCIVSQDLYAARRLYEFRRTHMDWQAGYTDITDVASGALGWYFLSELAGPCADKYDFTRLKPEIDTMIRLTEERPPLRALLQDAIVMYSLHCRDDLPFLVLRQGALHAVGEELALVGPFREQGLDRPGRLKELTEIFKTGAHSFDKRIEAIEEATALAASVDIGQTLRDLLELVEHPEAGLTFTLLEALSAEWRLHNHVTLSLLWMRGLAAIFRLSKREEMAIQDRKKILDLVILICLNHPWGISLVHLEEDWPADDPHRIAPYLIDPDRPQRLLLGELIIRLTEGLEYDPKSYEDHELYNRISHARQILQANERAVRDHLKHYDPRPARPARFAWLRNLLIPSARKAHRGKRLAAVLQQYRDLYVGLPGRPEIIFRHYPFAYDTSQSRKRLESTGASSALPSGNTPPPDISSTTETPERKDSGRK